METKSMKTAKWGPVALFAVSMPFLLALWPAGCANKQHSAKTAENEQPDTVFDSGSGATFLPHPAFAYADTTAGGSASIADIAERVLPSVVNISSSRLVKGHPGMDDPMFRHFFGPMMPDGEDHREQGLGSGVIVSADGIVLTNNHVIDKADEIKVKTVDNREFDVEILGTDDKSDLAVLRLKGDLKGLSPLKFGDSNRLRLGDVVLAVGNPFGVGQTVTMGIVSAKDRSNLGMVDYEDFIQTDAAINPGNSGGALINMAGELVGINTLIYSRSGGSMGIGFAIPTRMAQPIADSLVKQGKYTRGWLGVGIQDLDTELAKALNLNISNGVVITDVAKDSPAAKAGVQRSDVVVAVSGQKVDSTGRLRNLIAQAGATKVKIDLLRSGKPMSIEVNLGEAPTDKQAGPGAGKVEHQQGLVVEPINDAHRKRFGIEPTVKAGVVVTDLRPTSAAAEAGLRVGDVVVEVDQKPVASVDQFNRAFAAGKDRSLLLVNRGGSTVFVVVKKK
jgi:serine protease Do